MALQKMDVQSQRMIVANEYLQAIVPENGLGWYKISSSPRGTTVKIIEFSGNRKPCGSCNLPADQFFARFDGQDWKS